MKGSERRRYPRAPFFAEIRVMGKSEAYFHPTCNLSEKGVFLNTEFPLETGTHVVVELPTLAGSGHFTVVGHVAWRRRRPQPGTLEALAQPSEEPGMGICFEPVGEVEQGYLKELVGANVPGAT